jgi:hypothetical protein
MKYGRELCEILCAVGSQTCKQYQFETLLTSEENEKYKAVGILLGYVLQI